MFSSKKFAKFLEFSKHKNKEIANFFQSKIVKEVWNLKKKHFITKSMKKEIQSIRQILAALNFYKWEVLIWHLIPSNYECKVLGYACLEGGRAFGDEFKIW